MVTGASWVMPVVTGVSANELESVREENIFLDSHRVPGWVKSLTDKDKLTGEKQAHLNTFFECSHVHGKLHKRTKT